MVGLSRKPVWILLHGYGSKPKDVFVFEWLPPFCSLFKRLELDVAVKPVFVAANLS